MASSSHGEHVPLPGHAFQLVGPTVVELETLADHEVAHRARDEHLTGAAERADTCADVDGMPTRC